jgi:hypothetical protein
MFSSHSLSIFSLYLTDECHLMSCPGFSAFQEYPQTNGIVLVLKQLLLIDFN